MAFPAKSRQEMSKVGDKDVFCDNLIVGERYFFI